MLVLVKFGKQKLGFIRIKSNKQRYLDPQTYKVVFTQINLKLS